MLSFKARIQVALERFVQGSFGLRRLRPPSIALGSLLCSCARRSPRRSCRTFQLCSSYVPSKTTGRDFDAGQVGACLAFIYGPIEFLRRAAVDPVNSADLLLDDAWIALGV